MRSHNFTHLVALSRAERPPTRPFGKQAGFTAVELLVTIGILGILVAMAAPSFTSLMERWRVRQASEALQSTLYMARSEAIKRGGNVVIQKLPSGTNGCTGATSNADWDCGWYVCHDTNRDGDCDSNEPVLQRFDAAPNVQISRTGGAATIKLDRWGTVDGSYPGFSLVPAGKPTTDASAIGICMSSGGRVRVVPPEEIPCTS